MGLESRNKATLLEYISSCNFNSNCEAKFIQNNGANGKVVSGINRKPAADKKKEIPL